MDTKQFKRNVSCETIAAIQKIIEQVELSELVGRSAEFYDSQETNPIEGNYKDGWIPKQDGGYSIDAFIRSDADSSYHLTREQTEYMRECENNMMEIFKSENNLEEVDYDNEYLCDRLAEYELEWYEPALLQFQIFVERKNRFDDDSEKQIVCRLSINYKDAPYYREKYAEDIKVIAFDEQEFIQLANGDFAEFENMFKI